MTLKEAIRIKEQHLNHRVGFPIKELEAADNLSIEALKGIQAWRVDYDDNPLISLPGETKE